MSRLRCAVVVCALFWCGAWQGAAEASLCPVRAGFDESLARVDGEERLRYLKNGLHHAAFRAHVWTAAWGAIYTGLVAGQLALVPFIDPAARVERYVGSTAAFLAALLVVGKPLKVIYDGRDLDRRYDALAIDEDPCALLALAEAMLVRDATMEDRVNKWWIRGGAFAFSLGCGLLLSIGFQRYLGAAINTFGGMTIGQLMTNTQPTESLDLLRRYRAGHLTRLPAFDRPMLPMFSVAPIVGKDLVGLAAQILF